MRTRTGPYRALLESARAQCRDDGVVAQYADPLAEYWAVRDGGLGIADRSERDTLAITGADTVPWLQGMVTNDLMLLEREGSGQRSVAASVVGRTVADMRLLHLPALLYVDLEPNDLTGRGVLSHFKRHVITERVRLADRSAHTARLTLLGHRAPALLDALLIGPRRPSALALYDGGWGTLCGAEVVVQRIELAGAPSFDVSCSADDAALVWESLMGRDDRLRPVGELALERLRLEAGVVRFGHDLDEKRLPVEAGLNEGVVDYEKGCYIGQEILHRLDTRGTPARILRALDFGDAAAPPAPGAPVSDAAGKKVGEVSAAYTSPALEGRAYARAYLKRGAYELGTELAVEGRAALVAPLDAAWRAIDAD